MKKIGFAALCILCLCLMTAGALAGDYGTAIVDGKNSTKVHLREEASSDSASKGLYFTGTEVEMRSDPNQKWVRVRVGGDSGYMRSSYLRRGKDREKVGNAFYKGVITAKNYANFRRGPSTEYNLLGTINNGQTVTVMGETSDHWYYVKYKGECGFVSGSLLKRAGSGTTSSSTSSTSHQTSSGTSNTQYVPNASALTQVPYVSIFPSGMPLKWTHLSGAGAWRTNIALDLDGFFYGTYSDSEGNMVYQSAFGGRFTNVRRMDAYSYQMELSGLYISGTIGEAKAENGILYVTQEPAGIDEGSTYTLYLPGTPISRLPEEALPWLHQESGSTLNTHFLMSQNTGRGFIPE